MDDHPGPAITQPCTLCSQPTSLWCGRCHSAWYCSPKHIHDDWPRHREECNPNVCDIQERPYNKIATPPPAEPEFTTISAIYLSQSEERPRTIFVNCRSPPKGSQDLCPTPDLDGFFEDTPMSILLTQGLNGDPLRFPLQIWYSPTLLSQPGVPPNRAIFHLTCGVSEKHWTGPVVVLKHNGSRRQGYTDASMNDLPALSAYFLAYK